jgi:hypothetical protein
MKGNTTEHKLALVPLLGKPGQWLNKLEKPRLSEQSRLMVAGGTECMDRMSVESPDRKVGADGDVGSGAGAPEASLRPKDSILSRKSLTGKPSARDWPARFGGRGSGYPLSLPYSSAIAVHVASRRWLSFFR